MFGIILVVIKFITSMMLLILTFIAHSLLKYINAKILCKKSKSIKSGNTSLPILPSQASEPIVKTSYEAEDISNESLCSNSVTDQEAYSGEPEIFLFNESFDANLFNLITKRQSCDNQSNNTNLNSTYDNLSTNNLELLNKLYNNNIEEGQLEEEEDDAEDEDEIASCNLLSATAVESVVMMGDCDDLFTVDEFNFNSNALFNSSTVTQDEFKSNQTVEDEEEDEIYDNYDQQEVDEDDVDFSECFLLSHVNSNQNSSDLLDNDDDDFYDSDTIEYDTDNLTAKSPITASSTLKKDANLLNYMNAKSETRYNKQPRLNLVSKMGNICFSAVNSISSTSATSLSTSTHKRRRIFRNISNNNSNSNRNDNMKCKKRLISLENDNNYNNTEEMTPRIVNNSNLDATRLRQKKKLLKTKTERFENARNFYKRRRYREISNVKDMTVMDRSSSNNNNNQETPKSIEINNQVESHQATVPEILNQTQQQLEHQEQTVNNIANKLNLRFYKPSGKVEKLLNDSRGMKKYLIDYDILMSQKKRGLRRSRAKAYSLNNISSLFCSYDTSCSNSAIQSSNGLDMLILSNFIDDSNDENENMAVANNSQIISVSSVQLNNLRYCETPQKELSLSASSSPSPPLSSSSYKSINNMETQEKIEILNTQILKHDEDYNRTSSNRCSSGYLSDC